jgi:hypothetical protein
MYVGEAAKIPARPRFAGAGEIASPSAENAEIISRGALQHIDAS